MPWRKIPLTRLRVKFEAEKPVKGFLRKRNVLTMLAVAGLMLSIAALLVVIGIGETQIVASENAGNHTANLFANGWFDVGLLLAALGILIGTIAISANSSQAAALKEFPNLFIEIFQTGPASIADPESSPYSQLRTIGLRITNRERVRNASLDFRLNCGSVLWPPGPPWPTIAKQQRLQQDVRIPILQAVEGSNGVSSSICRFILPHK